MKYGVTRHHWVYKVNQLHTSSTSKRLLQYLTFCHHSNLLVMTLTFLSRSKVRSSGSSTDTTSGGSPHPPPASAAPSTSTCPATPVPPWYLATRTHWACRAASSREYGQSMMTSLNGNIFSVIGLLCGEFTGHWWIPLTKASDMELWFAPVQRIEQTIETQVIWDAITLIMTSL